MSCSIKKREAKTLLTANGVGSAHAQTLKCLRHSEASSLVSVGTQRWAPRLNARHFIFSSRQLPLLHAFRRSSSSRWRSSSPTVRLVFLAMCAASRFPRSTAISFGARRRRAAVAAAAALNVDLRLNGLSERASGSVIWRARARVPTGAFSPARFVEFGGVADVACDERAHQRVSSATIVVVVVVVVVVVFGTACCRRRRCDTSRYARGT